VVQSGARKASCGTPWATLAGHGWAFYGAGTELDHNVRCGVDWDAGSLESAHARARGWDSCMFGVTANFEEAVAAQAQTLDARTHPRASGGRVFPRRCASSSRRRFAADRVRHRPRSLGEEVRRHEINR